jgi:hypothetical protein
MEKAPPRRVYRQLSNHWDVSRDFSVMGDSVALILQGCRGCKISAKHSFDLIFCRKLTHFRPLKTEI